MKAGIAAMGAMWNGLVLMSSLLLVALAHRPDVAPGRGLLQNPISGPLPPGFKPPELSCDFGGIFPYMVSVRDRVGNHLCGGVLVDSMAVLTAAHCVDPRVSSGSSPRPLLYIGGANNDSPVEVRKTSKTVIPKGWSGEKEDCSDIALLLLNETTCVKPIPKIGTKLKASLKGTFLSFGRTSTTGAFSGQLVGGEYTYVQNGECADTYDLRQPPTHRTMCVRSSDAGGLCAGTEGGPLVFRPSPFEFADELMGIASYNTGPCEDVDTVGIFTKVNVFKFWIRKEVAKAKAEMDEDKKGRK